MRPTTLLFRAAAVLLAAGAVISGPDASFAGDPYSDKDFTLRLPAAISRFATYGDVAGLGGASAGSKWSSSVNPASTAWIEDPPRNVVLGAQYTNVWFAHGMQFHVPAETATVNLGKFGYLTGSAAQIDTSRETMMNSGLDFHMAGDLGYLSWAKKFQNDWAAGFTFTYTKSVSRMFMGNFEVAKSNSDSYGIRGGILKQIVPSFLAGLVVDYGWSSDRTSVAFPPARLEDSTRQLIVHPGISYEYMKNGTIYLDYEFGTFWNDTGRLNVHRILGGVEHGITDWLFLRAGTAIDPGVGAAAWTGGIGIYPTKWLSIDVAYQYDMFPELREEFGRSNTFNVSISITF